MLGGMIWIVLLFLFVVLFVRFVLARSDVRDAGIEAKYPPRAPFVQVDGQDVHVIVEGEGPDLVLLHGAGGNARDFTYRFTDHLKDRFRVYSVDRPGHGWSAPIHPRAYHAWSGASDTPRDQACRIADAVGKLGAEVPLVLGHSYGGAVAMAWALERDTRGLLILSGATMPWRGPLQPFYRYFGSRLGSAIGPPLVSAFVNEAQVENALSNVFAPAPVDPSYMSGAAIRLGTRSENFRANARQVNTLLRHVTEQSKHYETITIPVEIVHGTADVSVPAETHAIPLSERLPNAKLTLLEGLGHAPQHVAPEPIIDILDRLKQRSGLL